MNETKLVQAIAIDYYHIYTLCCNDKCPDHIHKYGSNRNLSDRIEYRCCHCPDDNTQIKIRIDETTKRCKLNYYTKNKSITLSKRDFKRQKKAIDEESVKDKFAQMKQAYKESLKNSNSQIIYEISREPLQVTFD